MCARPADRAAVGIEQSLQQGESVRRRCCGGRPPGRTSSSSCARELEVAQHGRHRIRCDHAAATAAAGPLEHVVHPGLQRDIGGGQGRVERFRQLRVLRGEARSGRRGDAPVAEQQAQGVRVQRDVAVRDRHWLDHRQLVAMGVRPAKVVGHLLGLEHPAGLAVATVIGRRHEPQVLAAGPRGRAVLGGHPVDLLATLRVHAQHGRRRAVAARPRSRRPGGRRSAGSHPG